MKKIVYVMLSAALAATLLAGCGSTTEEAPAESAAPAVVESADAEPEVVEEEVEVIEEPAALGTEAEGEDIYQIALTNASGKNIKAFAVKKADDEEFGDNLLADEDVFENGQERQLYLDAQTEADDEVAFEIRVTTEDDVEYVLHEVPYADVDTMEFHIEDEEDIAYLVYNNKDAAEGETESTLEAEQAIANPVEEETDVVVETQETETAPVQTAPVETPAAPVETPAAPVETPVAPVDPAPVDPAPTEPSTPDDGAAGDGCVDDGLTY